MLGTPTSNYATMAGPQFGAAGTLDTNAVQDRLCSMSGSGMECKGRTTAVTVMYKALQQAINQAAQVLNVPNKALVIDGILGRKTANLFKAVLEEDTKTNTPVPGSHVYAWTNDPRTGKLDTFASLLSMQPQYGRETMNEIAARHRPTAPPPTAPTTTPSTPSTPSTTATHPTTATTSTSSLTTTPEPKKFWTRRKKIALASVAVLALGLLAYVLLSRQQTKDDYGY